jgi:hypothetical protein
MNKIQNKVSCEKIEPYFYEDVELCPIATQIAYPNHTLTQTHHSPGKLVTINLQIFKHVTLFSNGIIGFVYQKLLCFQVLFQVYI